MVVDWTGLDWIDLICLRFDRIISYHSLNVSEFVNGWYRWMITHTYTRTKFKKKSGRRAWH